MSEVFMKRDLTWRSIDLGMRHGSESIRASPRQYVERFVEVLKLIER